jgi:methylase of polypeptide subunit release factors
VSGATSIEFGRLRVTYDSAVLRPRPWTLVQSEWAAELSAELPEGPILELCAGAGHIGLHAALVTGRRLVQVDGDPGATRLAAQNAAAAGVTDYEIRCARIVDAAQPGEVFPLIVADPPYIPSADVGQFPDDPPFAIDGGEDGLGRIRDCLAVAETHLAVDGSRAEPSRRRRRRNRPFLPEPFVWGDTRRRL